jgi:hypothetical protein
LYHKRFFKDKSGEYCSAEDIESDIEEMFGLSKDQATTMLDTWLDLTDANIPTDNFIGSKAIYQKWETIGFLSGGGLTNKEKWVMSHKFEIVAKILMSYDSNIITKFNGKQLHDGVLTTAFPVIRRSLIATKFKYDFDATMMITFVNDYYVFHYDSFINNFPKSMNTHMDAESEFTGMLSDALSKEWELAIVNNFIDNEQS